MRAAKATAPGARELGLEAVCPCFQSWYVFFIEEDDGYKMGRPACHGGRGGRDIGRRLDLSWMRFLTALLKDSVCESMSCLKGGIQNHQAIRSGIDGITNL